MKVAKACRHCRVGKRKCIRTSPERPCQPCTARNLSCPSTIGTSNTERALLYPKPSPRYTEPRILLDQVGASEISLLDDLALSVETVDEFIRLYLEKIHDRPHSLFHPATLLKQLREGSLDKALLYAICATGCRFSHRAGSRLLESPMTAKSKHLFMVNLENICIENIQTCVLLANLSAANCNHASEALFFRESLLIRTVSPLAVRVLTSLRHRK